MIGFYKMSIIGETHKAWENGVCQDASDAMVLKNGWVVAAIADGLGSAKKSEEGSLTAVKTVLSFVSENHPDIWHDESLISLLRTAYHKAAKAIKDLSETNKDEFCDYDTTLSTVIYNGTNAVYGHIGDGGIIALSSYGDYSVLTRTQKGEAFNETFPLRSGPDNWSFGVSNEDVCALVMMTDGIFDVAYPWLLARKEQPIYINYVRRFMDMNVLKLSSKEDFAKLEKKIEDYFTGDDSKRITDDKTIVGIINTDVIPEMKPDSFYQEPDWKLLSKEHHDRLYCSRETSLVEALTVQKSEKSEDSLAEEAAVHNKGTEHEANEGQDGLLKKRKGFLKRFSCKPK